jgi:hypothetical protein
VKRNTSNTSNTRASRAISEKTVNRGRHEYQCSVCSHGERKEIEEAFVNWLAPGRIAKRYGVSRDAIYRHAHALSLMELRQRNVRAALEKIIERACEVKANAAAVVSAVSAYARINSRGELIERTQSVNLNQLFNQMTVAELEAYAKTGALPEWIERTLAAIGSEGREEVRH